jgi:hypothetical protein
VIGMQMGIRGGVAEWCVLTALVLGTMTVKAQDTRQVSEPTIPASCVRLPAQLRSVSEKLADADEHKLDTARIQAALDQCKPGMAVELTPANGNNAFLSGPLEMRTGVTLLIDEGVTLFGSRDAAEYEVKGEGVTPGLCGTIAAGAPPAVFPAPQRAAPARGGCRPFISILDAKNVGIMGDGVIDGRGYGKILGKDYSGDGSEGGAEERAVLHASDDRGKSCGWIGDVPDYAAQLDELSCERESDGWIYGVGSAPADSDDEGDGCAEYGWDRSRVVDECDSGA